MTSFPFSFVCSVKANNANLKIDLYINGDLLDQNDDRKLISQLNIRDKTVSRLVFFVNVLSLMVGNKSRLAELITAAKGYMSNASSVLMYFRIVAF